MIYIYSLNLYIHYDIKDICMYCYSNAFVNLYKYMYIFFFYTHNDIYLYISTGKYKYTIMWVILTYHATIPYLWILNTYIITHCQEGDTALIIAASNNHLKYKSNCYQVCKVLLENGADIDIKDKVSYTNDVTCYNSILCLYFFCKREVSCLCTREINASNLIDVLIFN